MTNAELELLKASLDRQVEIDIKGGERLRVKVLFVFDEETSPELFYEAVPTGTELAPDGRTIGGYSLALTEILSVRPVVTE